jgi:hypothetical protein
MGAASSSKSSSHFPLVSLCRMLTDLPDGARSRWNKPCVNDWFRMSAKATRIIITGFPRSSRRPSKAPLRNGGGRSGEPDCCGGIEPRIGFAPTTFMRVAGRRVKFLALSPSAPSLDLGYVVHRGEKNGALESFLEALRSVSSDADRRS